MSYTPKEGSIPARAIAHLAQMADVEVSAADLASAIGTPPTSVQSGMATAVAHGAVHYRVVGHTGYYSLAEGDDEPPQRNVISAAGLPAPETTAAPSVFALGAQVNPQVTSGFKGWAPGKSQPQRSAKPAQAARPTGRPVAPPAKAKRGVVALIPAPVADAPPQQTTRPPSLRCAVFNTGELLLEAPGQPPLRLDGAQTADLLRWLQRVQPSLTTEPA